MVPPSNANKLTYTYDARGRILTVKLGNSNTPVATYGYDWRQHRVASRDGASAQVHYLFDDEGHLLAEYDALSGNLLREYAWAGDMVLAMATGAVATPSWSYIATGHLNEPVMVTNQAGAVVSSTTRDPWGNPILIAGSNVIALGYPGQWKDLAGGLFHNHHRDYDPTLGRYIEADPIGLDGGSNVYGYVGGNPVNWVDPEGLTKVIFFSPFTDNSFWKGAMSEPDMPGICLVYGHMAPDRLVDGRGRGRVLKDLAEIHSELMKSGCKPRQPVYFLGCRAGLGDESIAARYAREYGVRTVASTRYTWWQGPRPDDRFWPYGYAGTFGRQSEDRRDPRFGRANANDPGEWRVFGR